MRFLLRVWVGDWGLLLGHWNDEYFVCVRIPYFCSWGVSLDVDLFSGRERTFDCAVFSGTGGRNVAGSGYGALRISF
jgi:hypothetical protein